MRSSDLMVWCRVCQNQKEGKQQETEVGVVVTTELTRQWHDHCVKVQKARTNADLGKRRNGDVRRALNLRGKYLEDVHLSVVREKDF